MQMILIACAVALVVSVALILQKTMNMFVAQQELDNAERDSRTSGWLLVVAIIACAVLVL